MTRSDYIVREKRLYNKWVASQTLEDYALRYTADKARHWSARTVAGTAIGATAFLACEAIGASITLAFGFANSVAAIGAAVVLMFLIGVPIAYHAAKEGLDIDLLTRGAGFGYLGSTLTSLIYASFTFLLFAVEASIMSVAIQALLGVHISVAHLISTLIVIPIALYGMSAITRFQALTQPIWIVLQLAPIAYLLWKGGPALEQWTLFVGREDGAGEGVSLILFGLALSTLLSLLPQIGEQADYLRFMPKPEKIGRTKWLVAVMAAGPGWILIGGAKLLLGSVLAVYVLGQGGSDADASSPTAMFRTVFTDIFSSAEFGLIATGLFVVVCQLKINVTNAYAGSIAWSNFFSRLTHSHPGRVVWLVFNVLLALLLMEMGIFDAIEGVLMLYANLAAGWIGALTADLVVSKPLGLSPKGVEFKRAYLYDINPVGVGALLLSAIASGLTYSGLLGDVAEAFSPIIGLCVAFIAAPLIAWVTKGRYYLARTPELSDDDAPIACTICENEFQPRDMAGCAMFKAPICSLCCTLEVRCQDMCKTNSRFDEQSTRLFERILPKSLSQYANTAIGQSAGLILLATVSIASVLVLIYLHHTPSSEAAAADMRSLLSDVFVVFTLIAGVTAWIVVLAHRSRQSAFRESAHHMEKLVDEIAAHEVTDSRLQQAKQIAEDANRAKSRFLVSVSHEIRSPLNSIYGYAQLLEKGGVGAPENAGRIIRRSSEHLSNLVEGLMEMSQVEGGVLKLERDIVHFPDFLDQIADMLRPQARAKGLNFVYDPAKNLPEYVRTDPKRLRQILINILSNAIKFTPRGDIVFRISYRSEIAHFEISDTGVGISPDNLTRIFEPFERIDQIGASKAPGIGLGLSIARVLAHVMGAEIAVESEVGVGTVFRVRAMLSRPMKDDIDKRHRRQAFDAETGHDQKVLIIDDDPNQLALVSSFLAPQGYQIAAFGSVAAGLKAVDDFAPDIALLDVNMPDQSGWDAAESLRARYGARLYIVMISADSQSAKTHDPTHELHDKFLAKPFNFDDLHAVLTAPRILQTSDGGIDATPAANAPPERSDANMTQPTAHDLGAILKDIKLSAETGHVSGVKHGLDLLEQAAPDAHETAQRIKTRLDAFDLAGVADIASEHEEPHD